MKKKITVKVMVVAGVMALAGWVMSGSAWAVISGSAHDFSAASWNTTGEICNVCHTPHNATDTKDTTVPLWNHSTTTATFTPYSSTTLDATVGSPSGISLACLSCHDGTVALNSFGGNGTPTGGDESITGDAKLGNDLSNDHPISFTYDATLAGSDSGLYNPTTQTSGLGGTIDADMLVAGQVECSSCHDVHNGPGTVGAELLVKDNAGSALCLTCHNK